MFGDDHTRVERGQQVAGAGRDRPGHALDRFVDEHHSRGHLLARASQGSGETVEQGYATESLRTHSHWQLEGWAAARRFTEAAESRAGSGITRACADASMNRSQSHTADGLLLPVGFGRLPEPPKTPHLSVGRPLAGRQGPGDTG